MNRVSVENVNHLGSIRQVDAVPYEAMKRAYLAILSSAPNGLTIEEIRDRLGTHLPQEIFPGGALAGSAKVSHGFAIRTCDKERNLSGHSWDNP